MYVFLSPAAIRRLQILGGLKLTSAYLSTMVVNDAIVLCSSVPSRASVRIADAVVPPIYHKAFAAVDPTGSGDTTVNALSRVLQTSLLPAATVDKVRFQNSCTPSSDWNNISVLDYQSCEQ